MATDFNSNETSKKGGDPLTNTYVRDYYDSYLERHPESYSQSRWFSSNASRLDYEQTKRALLSALGDKMFTSAVEIGPGDGAWTSYIGERVEKNLTLIEQSEQMVARVKGLIAEKKFSNVTIIHGSFPSDAPTETFDLVVSVRAFEYFEDKQRALDAIARLLKPGARAIIVTKNPHYIALHGKPSRTLHTGQIDKEDISALAAASGLTVKHSYPATLRWVARWSFFRALFDAFHRWTVFMKTDNVLPILSRYASESFLYVLVKNQNDKVV